MFNRIRMLLAAYDRGDFTEAGLASRLAVYADRAERSLRRSNTPTQTGMPVAWCEP